MKDELLAYIEEKTKSLKRIQYSRNQAQAFIIQGQLETLKDIKKLIEKSNG